GATLDVRLSALRAEAASVGPVLARRAAPAPLTGVVSDGDTGFLYARQQGGGRFLRYDDAQDLWTDRAPCPLTADGRVGAVFLAGKIYLLSEHDATQVAVYDPVANSWETRPHPLGQLSAAI